MDFSVYQLRTFWEVARTGSLTKSAKNLGYSQSSVTAHVRSLESRVGSPLFHRLPHGVRLTAAGETFRVYVGRILSVMDEMSVALKNKGEPTGRVVVGATAPLMEYELQEILRECRYRYPRIHLSLKVMSTKDVEAAVASGGVDVGLTFTRDARERTGGTDGGLLREVLFSVPFVPVGPAAHRAGDPSPMDRVLVVDPDCASQEILPRHLASLLDEAPTLMETGSTRGALGLASGGLGVAMVPQAAVGCGSAPDGLTVIDSLPGALVHVQALLPGGGWLSPAVSAFLSVARRAERGAPFSQHLPDQCVKRGIGNTDTGDQQLSR
ncbi:LysR family transcriptional regulator [Streptomyces sp. URMC 125]|uniref:LysR family transcriptional regulator n=1 Tax=Streptomyces sp. URMC 125 TaxID=3423419 RepID=UPI003F1DD484